MSWQRKASCNSVACLCALALPCALQAAADTTAVDTSHCWRWEQLKPAELEQALKTVPVAYLVVSPLEWHGEAMSFGTDPVIGMAIAEKAWRKTGGVLIPTLYLGAETEYHDWSPKGLADYWGLEWNAKEHLPGSLYIRPTTLELVLREMLAFIEKEGFLTCVLVSGHGATEHVRVLKDIEERWQDRPMRVVYSKLPERKRSADMRYEGSGSHADFAEASNLGGVDPTMVDKGRFGVTERDRTIKLLSENAGKIDFDKGARVVASRAEQLAEAVRASLGPGITRPIPADKGFHKRIDCGALRGVQDAKGFVWEGDRIYGGTGSRADRGDITIAGTAVPEIYRTEAYALGAYTIPVPAGPYQVVLHFAETYEGTNAAGQRLLDVTINGRTVLSDFDVYKEAGMKRNTAVVRTFDTNAPDGAVTIAFGSKTGNAIVNAIEIVARPR
jgi:creatinine amidohydrolase/Fe(II)-dependent formamide hydrolase-like protein